MDWVENKAKRERLLLRRQEQLWDGLCMAIEKAVESFNKYYRHPGAAVEPSRPYQGHFEVRYTTSKPPDRTLHLRLTQDNAIEADLATKDITTKSIVRFTLDNENDVVLSLDGKTVTQEEASRALLEPVLFEARPELNLDVD